MNCERKFYHFCSRSPHGERGLKLATLVVAGVGLGRSPHGERGLKWEFGRNYLD